jgi:hypothetical protein
MPKGVYERNDRHRYRRITPRQALQLKQEYDEGISIPKLALKYDIAKSTVTRAVVNNGGIIRNHAPIKPVRGLLGWLHSE